MTSNHLVVTDDHSPTFFSSQFQEHYHSLSGAYEEALNKFVLPSNIMTKSQAKNIKVLDICFGLGYNSLVTLDSCVEGYPISITAIELNRSIIEDSIKLKYPNLSWNNILSNLLISNNTNYNNGEIQLLIGDARKVLPNINNLFDIVYLDPFSTKNNSELWTEHFFKLIKTKLNHDGMILTYSSALPVRSGLLRSGFNIYESPPVGRRRGGTVASLTKQLHLNQLSEKDQYLITNSDGSIPYRDRTLNLGHTNIVSNRNKIIQYLLKKKKIKKVKQCYKENFGQKLL